MCICAHPQNSFVLMKLGFIVVSLGTGMSSYYLIMYQNSNSSNVMKVQCRPLKFCVMFALKNGTSI
jgi:hypothetical protein